MGPDDARLQDARAWLSKAELDLKAATHEISASAEALWGDVMLAPIGAARVMSASGVHADARFLAVKALVRIALRV